MEIHKRLSKYPKSNTNYIDVYDVPDCVVYFESQEHLEILINE